MDLIEAYDSDESGVLEANEWSEIFGFRVGRGHGRGHRGLFECSFKLRGFNSRHGCGEKVTQYCSQTPARSVRMDWIRGICGQCCSWYIRFVRVKATHHFFLSFYCNLFLFIFVVDPFYFLIMFFMDLMCLFI